MGEVTLNCRWPGARTGSSQETGRRVGVRERWEEAVLLALGMEGGAESPAMPGPLAAGKGGGRACPGPPDWKDNKSMLFEATGCTITCSLGKDYVHHHHHCTRTTLLSPWSAPLCSVLQQLRPFLPGNNQAQSAHR